MALTNLVQDLRYTFRSLRRDAGFTTFVILIAGLGIEASSMVCSAVTTLLLRPLPFVERISKFFVFWIPFLSSGRELLQQPVGVG